MTAPRTVTTIVALGMIGALAGMSTATAGGGGCHGVPTEGRGSRVEMIDACFTPSTLFARPGETITFVNRDGFSHNVTANGWGHFEDLTAGGRYTTSFADDGVYAYACSIHPGMSGSIVIGGGASGADVTSLETRAVAASAAPGSDGNGWIGAGAVGLVIGGVVGAGLARMRRRGTTA